MAQRRRENSMNVAIVNRNLDRLQVAKKPIELHPPEYLGALTLRKDGKFRDEDKRTLLVGPSDPGKMSFWREDGEKLQIYNGEEGVAEQRRFALVHPIGRLTMIKEDNLWVADLEEDNIRNGETIFGFIAMASLFARCKFDKL